jgi:hypothetical protein
MAEITAQSADGKMHVFPEGTDAAVIDRAMKQYAAEKPGVMSRIGTGFADPFYGAAQIGARMGPSDAGEAMGITMRGGDIEAETAERTKAVDENVRAREEAYQARRGPNDGMDIARGVGSIPSTAALSAPAMALGGIPGAVAAGATGGALQPTTGKNFATEKAEQTAIGGVAGGVIGTAGKLVGMGVRALGSYLAREFPENVATQAMNKVMKRFGQDAQAGGLTAQQAMDVVNEASRRGTPLTLADVGGENVKGLAGNVAREPGASRNIVTQTLDQRDRGAAQRIGRDINQYIHGGASMERTTEALLQARSAEARPLWDQVRSMQGVWSPRLQQFFEDPALRSGMARGYEIERLESLAEGREFNPTQMGVDLDQEGNILIRQTPNMRVIHMAKVGLDSMIAAERNEITGRLSSRGVALDRVRRAYLQEVDGLDRQGVYRAARAAWEGPSSSLDAVRAGRSAFQSSPEAITAEINGMSPANQEFYRLGVADAIRERLAKTGLSGDEAKSIVKNQWTRDQLRPIFRSDSDFDAFMQSVGWEGEMFGTKRGTTGGSDTARRLAEDQSGENLLASGGAELAEKMSRGSWLGAAKSAIRMWRDLGIRSNPKVNEEVARILFSTPIDAASETGQRISGTFTGPQSVNRLGGAANALENVGSVISPGAAAALDQPGLPQ